MKVKEAILSFVRSDKETKFFIFILALYMVALIWTTAQAYARLEYRSDFHKPIIIQAAPDDSKK